jgi:predicted ATPase
MESSEFSFQVIPLGGRVPMSGHSIGFLRSDNWDDWGEFSTLFHLVVFDSAGNKHEIGDVKIGQFGMKEGQRTPKLPGEFDNLDESFFSLGQDENYYEKLNELGEKLRKRILDGLRDMAAAPKLFTKALAEHVTKTSLLRGITSRTVRGQFRRMTQGGARLSKYAFTYIGPERKCPPIELSFQVTPDSNPPTNVHVLIGQNGVGKSYFLDKMGKSLVKEIALAEKVGQFISEDASEDIGLFANLVSVSFSAFDRFAPLPENGDEAGSIRYSYIGLRMNPKPGDSICMPKSLNVLRHDFVNSAYSCLHGARRARWLSALKTLESDPIFREAEVPSLREYRDDAEFKKNATVLFNSLSSGHKIVLLTITRLVETVEERTLVLLDEPEAHLHPPLLSAFVRALSNLLVNRNGVAIVATHSPVVLQEVPSSCVWKLRRIGSQVRAERPVIETFGENLGTLTSEIFGFEVTESGFHRLIRQRVKLGGSFSKIIQYFDGRLGGEAQAILAALIAERDSRKG